MAICLNCGRERVLRSHNFCSGCSSIVDRVPPRKRKEALAAFKEQFQSGAKEIQELGPKKTSALRVEDFYRARLLREEVREKYPELREKYPEFFR